MAAENTEAAFSGQKPDLVAGIAGNAAKVFHTHIILSVQGNKHGSFCQIIRELEQRPDAGLDELCEPTAKMTAAMLSLLSEEPGERRVLERLGYLLGRYIYMADALDDWEKDKKHGDFNPFLQCEDEPEALKRHARASLLLTIGEMGAALDLLELRHFGPILENIIRLGLPQTVEELQLPPKQRRKREK